MAWENLVKGSGGVRQGVVVRGWVERVRSVLALLGCCACLVTLSGCETAFDTHRRSLEALHAQGRFDIAAQTLDTPTIKTEYGEDNRLLYWLDRGAVALANNDPRGSIDWLEKAEAFMEVHREPSAGEEFGRWLINDTVTPYYGSSYEELYVNVFKLLAQLQLGKIDGGATVEARRVAGKADVLRDRYVRTREAVVQRADDRVRLGLNGSGYVDANVGGEFVDSTLGTFLTAVAFMKDGDRQSQSVAGKRLTSAVDLQTSLQGGVSSRSFDGIGERDPSTVNVLVVGLSGRGPTKVAKTIGPIPVYQWPVYFQLPELVGGSEEAASVRLVVDAGTAGPSPGSVDTYPLVKVEDMRAVAAENFRRELPLIYARTLLRSSLKAAASYAATEAVKRQAGRGSGRDAAQIGLILAGLAFVAITEKADLRSWVFLPARADAAVLKLTPGRHRVRVEYLSSGGGLLHAGAWREIDVPSAATGDGSLTTIVEHFWR